MGWRGIASADMFFDNVEVPVENIIVPAGGFKKLMEAFDLERCGNTTMSLACGQSAFDYALDYVQEREQFGKPIIEFQAVQLQIAQMKMKLDAARLLCIGPSIMLNSPCHQLQIAQSQNAMPMKLRVRLPVLQYN